MKNKLPLIVLLVFLFISCLIVFQFYTQNGKLVVKNKSLVKNLEESTKNEKKLKTEKKKAQAQYQDAKSKLDKLSSEKMETKKAKVEVENKLRLLQGEREKLEMKIAELSKSGDSQSIDDTPRRTPSSTASSNEHWADVVRERAELMTKLNQAQKALLDVKAKMAEAQRNNKELSLDLDELKRQTYQMEGDLSFKERTLDIMSRDLVSEREARKDISRELERLRDEGSDLKRELIMANKEKINLQAQLQKVLEGKEDLEKTVNQVESILKERTLIFSELENRLSRAVKGSNDLGEVTRKSSSVELPAIVVNPQGSSYSMLRGEVLAVNKNDNFVIIDLGVERGSRPGDIYDVMRGSTAVGTIEVIETRKEISAADIKMSSSGYSIREGDTVVRK